MSRSRQLAGINLILFEYSSRNGRRSILRLIIMSRPLHRTGSELTKGKQREDSMKKTIVTSSLCAHCAIGIRTIWNNNYTIDLDQSGHRVD